MILKDLGERENYKKAIINTVRQYGDMMITPSKEKMAKMRIDLEYKEVFENVFKVIDNEENKKKIREAELDWRYIKNYHFDAAWFERTTGLEGAIKLV